VRTPEDVFYALVDGVRELNAGDGAAADRLAELYAPDTDVRHPMAPLGDTPLRGREALRHHFASRPPGNAARAGMHAEDVRIHHTTDPEVIVAEFTYRGDAQWSVPCVFVLRVRDGLIVESRDYIAHVEFARIAGTLAPLLEQLTTRA
jgi:ketosteroid isomerase-like protein